MKKFKLVWLCAGIIAGFTLGFTLFVIFMINNHTHF